MSAVRCNITNSGTKNPGTKASGNCVIGPMVAPPVMLDGSIELNPPMLTATTRSRIPSRFQDTKDLLAANPGR